MFDRRLFGEYPGEKEFEEMLSHGKELSRRGNDKVWCCIDLNDLFQVLFDTSSCHSLLSDTPSLVLAVITLAPFEAL